MSQHRLRVALGDITRQTVDAIPAQAASRIAVREALLFLDANPTFESVVLVAFRTDDAALLREAMASRRPESGAK